MSLRSAQLYLAVGTALLCGCQKAPPPASPSAQQMPQVPVTVAKAIETSVPLELRSIGTVEAYSNIQVKSQVAGILTHVYFHEGQDVRKGELLFQIDPRPYQQAVAQAEAAIARDQASLQQAQANLSRDQAQYQNAQAQAGRYERLAKEGVVSKEQNETFRTSATVQNEAMKGDQASIAQARASIQADTANLATAKLNLEFCQIRSPLDGRTGNLAVKEGNLVKAQADTALVTINQVHPIYVTFSAPESNLPDIRRFNSQGKLAVEVTIGQNPAAIAGHLTFIDNAVNTATGTILMKATFTNSDHRLWPGQFVDVILRLATQRNVILVPSEAVQTGQQGQYTFIVGSNGTVQNRMVKVGATVDKNIVIEQGVTAGETVVTDGQLRLVPGAPVKIVKTSQL